MAFYEKKWPRKSAVGVSLNLHTGSLLILIVFFNRNSKLPPYLYKVRGNETGNGATLSKKGKKDKLTLVGLDIEGGWNRPLLANAADISGASMQFSESNKKLHFIQNDFDKVVACETSKNSQSIFDFPAFRGSVALIVGNERKGIPKGILKKADRIVSIPMHGKNMTSVNVAVASAIALYTFTSDFARKKRRKDKNKKSIIDILLLNPENPYGLGSLLRSIWALGDKACFFKR